MHAIVSPNGRYHGHTKSEAVARKLDIIQKSKPGDYRLLSDSEWQQVAGNRGQREELCGKLGKAL